MAGTEKKKQTFVKEQIVSAKKYEDEVDIVNALLDEGKSYTLAEVDNIIDEFKKGRVN